MSGEIKLDEALSQSLKLEAAKAAAGPPARLDGKCFGAITSAFPLHTACRQIGDKSHVVTTDTEASVTIIRPDNITGLPERELTRLCVQ